MADTEPKLRLATEYASAAEQYARLWGPVIQPMGARLVHAMPLENAAAILDVGAGAGALLPALRASAPAALVAGIDRVERMLRQARAASPAAGTRLAVMDAEQLALRAAAFDAALLVFMLFHLPDPVRGLAETARVLREGGCAGTTTWGADQELPAAAIWDEELDAAGGGPGTLPAEVQQHGLVDAPDKVGRLMAAAGLEPVRLWTERFRRAWTWEELYRLRSGYGMHRRRLDTLAEEGRTRCLERIRARMRGVSAAALVWQPEVVFGLGRRM